MELEWDAAKAERNQAKHGASFAVAEIVWKTIHGDLPGLYARMQDVQATLQRD